MKMRALFFTVVCALVMSFAIPSYALSDKEKQEITKFFNSASSGNINGVKKYIDAGGDINAADRLGRTAFYYAIMYNKTEAAKLLMAHGAKDTNPREQKSRGRMPIHYAAMKGNIEIIKLLLASGVDVNTKEKDGTTPLMIAASNENNVQTADFLLKNGADINAKNSKGKSALSNANDLKRKKMVAFLKSKGAK